MLNMHGLSNTVDRMSKGGLKEEGRGQKTVKKEKKRVNYTSSPVLLLNFLSFTSCPFPCAPFLLSHSLTHSSSALFFSFSSQYLFHYSFFLKFTLLCSNSTLSAYLLFLSFLPFFSPDSFPSLFHPT